MIKSLSILAQPLRSKLLSPSVYTRTLRCVLCSLLISIAAPFAIPLPFCPVPIVLQVQLCLFFAAIYGAKEGFFIVLLFLLQGIMGAPVFAGGAFGVMHLLGTHGGYLMGYALGAFITGKMIERYKNRPMVAMGVGNIIVYIMGAVHLSNFIPMDQALLIGVLPYLPLDLVKIALFASLKKVITTQVIE